MANELKHGSVGTELTQAEWEAIGTHVFNSQATGDSVYASSSSQLSRLGVGSNTNVLTLASGIPSWAAPAAAAAGRLTGASLASGVTASSLTSVGTIATGVWQGTDVGVAYGGTGVSTLTDGGILLGSGASAITAMAVLTDSQMIVGNGSTDPVAESGATLRTSIGVGTGDAVEFAGITGTTIDASTDFTIGNTILTSELLNVATGGLTIGLAGSAPSPDGDGVHIWDGSAGSVTASADRDQLIIEASGNPGMSLLGTDSSTQIFAFGAPQGNLEGYIRYQHSVREMAFGVQAVARVYIDERGLFVNDSTVARNTTDPTKAISLFNGTAPVGTLANGVTLYSAAGELLVMDAAGNATTLS